VEADPQDAVPAQRYFEEGERALAENRYQDAAKAYEKLRQLDPNSAELHAKLGVIYFQAGDYAKAIPVLKQAQKLKPSLPNVDVMLAMSLAETGHHAEALPALQSGFQKSREAAIKRMAGLHLERSYTALGKDSKAVEVALELSRLYPDDPEVLYQTSRLFANYAYLAINRLSQKAPDSLWTHLAAGEAFESQGSHDLAVAEYREVAAMAPNRPGTYYRLGRSLLSATAVPNAKDEALKAFARELEIDPSNANAAYEIGELYRRGGDFGKARELFERAVKFAPEFQEAYVGLGKALIALNDNIAAVPVLRKAGSLDPSDDVPHFLLSRALQSTGDTAGQQKELADFQRLRNARNERQSPIKASREVTQQGLDNEGK
jgi:tetratricopeptide (TPR) repeat protein